ncbi:TPA: hypothetical protein ACXDAZ_003160 [Clostridium botulinum]|uniref:hypothetical protein n=1 Tax=Clostridium botulinum TaxID=1491 RepID=UPI0008FC8309|nr:hypothetical protein [Clostridium botulinum]APC81410.1 hypothetical protein NPD2_829 [Clostridium botulinum]APU61303.1 hypothetical protein NPD8_3262 [Clostridium botulinum]MCS4447334.1 hypothetical protein [Clostridium botulinum]MCS4456722.1 hypothetical protein [Clostridium botulinum]MCS4460508.1 hypothetical protein [Clostridium botulinum]
MLKKKHSILISILILIIGLMFFKTKFNTKKHYVTVNNIINKVYTCKDGYNEEMKDIVSEEAFFKANSYRFYDNPNFKRPISIDIKINEFNQKKIDNKIFIYFEYDLFIYDRDHKEICGVLKSPTVASIIQRKGKLYIEDIQEYETHNEVPKVYK